MRASLSLLLSLLLALTSVTFATARVQEAGLTRMVVCAQGAALVMTFDAAGNPVSAPHHCPDCLSALPPPLAATRIAARVPLPRPLVLAFGRAVLPPLGPVRASLARGPPALV